MKIRLNEIPEEGRHYVFNRETGELNEALFDLVGDRDYLAEMDLKPVGNVYELRGHVQTTLKEVCSTCGYDFELEINRTFHEILFEEGEEFRNGHSAQGNNSVDFLSEGPSMTSYRNNIFEAGEYVREMVALAEPFYPKCGGGDVCSRAAEVDEIRRRLDAEFAAADEDFKKGHPAFSILKSLDLNKKN